MEGEEKDLVEAGPGKPEPGSAGPPPGEASPSDAAGGASQEAGLPAGPTPAEGPAAAGPATELDVASALSFRGTGRRNDAAIELSVSEDGMLASALLIPPVGEGRPLDRSYLVELLDRLGILYGVQWEEVDEALLRCNLDRKLVRDFPVARGDPPLAEVPEHYELGERLQAHKPKPPDTNTRIDYKEISSLIVVRKGELLARLVPRVEGKAGSDVRGRETPFQRQPVPTCAAGKNVARDEEGLKAAVDGLLSITVEAGDRSRLDIEEILLVKGAVDYHTGHIVFPGDVIIEGTVGDGFKVWSGGSIVCKGTLDAFDVNAKKDLTCAQGIIGRRKAQVRAGGELRAKFIQNCRVAARGDVRVQTAIVNTRCYSLGTIDLGDRGVLMGGECYAVHGLRCGRIGNQAHQRTLIHVGTDFTVQQRLDQANEKLRLLAFRAQQVDARAAGRTGGSVDRLRAAVEQEVKETQALIGRLLVALDADEGAVVECRGDIFPGAVIEICRVSIVVEEPLKSCRFRLDKASGKVLVERAGGGAAAKAEA